MMKRPRPYDLTTHDGKRVDWLTKAALLKAERLLGYELSITQGSYNAGGVSQSAGTHDKGGVVDLKAWDWENKCRALRLSGFWAWRRRPEEGDWPEHIHAALAGNIKLAPSAFRQVEAGRAGRNGLANNGPDPHAYMVFKPFPWPYYGPVGKARWVRDQLQGAEREAFLRRLRRVVRGK